MAYNNYFPVGYQPYGYISPYNMQNNANLNDFQQSNTNIQPGRNVAQNGIIWVQGEAGAKAYPVAPNNTVQLWDSENQVIYLKSADVSGMPSMKVLDYSIREENSGNNVLKKDLSGYVTREEFEQKIAELMKKVNTDEQTV